MGKIYDREIKNQEVMKIGILTFHRTTNYGAALQAYALQNTLQGLTNQEILIIDYHNNDVYRYYDYRVFSDTRSLKTIIGKIWRYKYNRAVAGEFEKFRLTRMVLSNTCYSTEELCKEEKEYDVLICGSDQVWNPRAIFKDFKAYLLGTARCRKVAYAASVGNVSLLEPYLKTYWEMLHDFEAISVREKDLVSPIHNLSQKDVELVCDPTLLLDSEDWEDLEEDFHTTVPETYRNGYILVYFLGRNMNVVHAAFSLQKTTGLPIVSIGRKIRGSLRPKVGPSGFLTLFHYAKYVLTSSFHGTVFAIQYHKPFLVFGNGSYNSRMETLLEMLSLEDQMINNKTEEGEYISKIGYSSLIDWNRVEEKRLSFKMQSVEFLKKALNEDAKQQD